MKYQRNMENESFLNFTLRFSLLAMVEFAQILIHNSQFLFVR